MSGTGEANSVRQALSKAGASIRIEGEVVRRDGGTIAIRRGGSIFEVESKDVIAQHELEHGTTAVMVKADTQLIRSTLVINRWFGGEVGWRPVFDDCTECCDCTECSVCADCTECSVCTDCAECSVCVGEFGSEANSPQVVSSSWVRRFSGGRMGLRRRMR